MKICCVVDIVIIIIINIIIYIDEEIMRVRPYRIDYLILILAHLNLYYLPVQTLVVVIVIITSFTCVDLFWWLDPVFLAK